jgi:hypothetical protein
MTGPTRAVTQRARTDLTGDDLAGVQTHPEPQVDTVAVCDRSAQSRGLILNAQRCKTSPDCMILQRHGRAEHRHDAIAGELAQCAAVALDHRRRPLDQLGRDLRSRSGPTAAAMSIE